MSATATKICARVTNKGRPRGLNALDLEFITTGLGRAEETPKAGRRQGFVPGVITGENRAGAGGWTQVSIFRANLDGLLLRLFGMAAMHPISKLPPFDRESGDLNIIIDTPKGSRNKFSWDEKRHLFELSGVLPAGAVFPYDFGFI